MSKEFLITGSGGQLGKALVEQYPEASAMTKSELDIANQDQVDAIDWSRYSTIINAAAYVNADQSETEAGREVTWRANAEGPRNLARVALRHGLQLIHFSSEYVFDGTVDNHSEQERFSPLQVYGQTKAAADFVVGLVPDHKILRTTWVVGDGHNFVKTMKTLGDVRINPKVVNDQFGRLTFTSELTRAVDHVITNNVAPGTYNLSNSGDVKSWADFAALTFEMAGHDKDRVQYVTTQEYSADKPAFAPRPQHSALDLSKIQATGFESEDYLPLLRQYIASLPDAE